MHGCQAAVQHDLHTEGRQIDVPRFNQGLEKRDAVFVGNVEDVRLQELEHDDAHLPIASAGESSHAAEPPFIVQFLFRHPLDDVQQLLRHQAFEGPERLLFERRTDGLFLARFACAKNQLTHVLE